MKFLPILAFSTVGSFAIAQVDIPTTLTNENVFQTLMKSMETGGLIDDLSAEGPFTIFATTDESFACYPEIYNTCFWEDSNLSKYLLYHVVPGKIMSTDITGNMTVDTLNGETMTIELAQGYVLIDGYSVILQADIEATNGVIHAIDDILFPPSVDVEAWAAACEASTLPPQEEEEEEPEEEVVVPPAEKEEEDPPVEETPEEEKPVEDKPGDSAYWVAASMLVSVVATFSTIVVI